MFVPESARQLSSNLMPDMLPFVNENAAASVEFSLMGREVGERIFAATIRLFC